MNNTGRYAIDHSCALYGKEIMAHWYWFTCLKPGVIETCIVEKWKWRNMTGTTTITSDDLVWLKKPEKTNVGAEEEQMEEAKVDD